jgi:hypothetical protein
VERFPTPAPIPELRPETVAVIIEGTYNTILREQAYRARVYFGDVRTSLYCGHRHKTPKAAAKCAGKLRDETVAVLRQMETIIDVTNFDGPPMFDIVYQQQDSPGSPSRTTSRRFYVKPEYIEGANDD